MIGELLDVTRAGAGKLSIDLKLTSVVECVKDSVAIVQNAANAKEIQLAVDVPNNMPLAYADPDRVRQVLVNLLENAIKFTPGKGSVSLKGWPVPGEPPMLQFAVTDTGCGIPRELFERIFERMYQVSKGDSCRQGLGLGLYICHELVTRQGGRIWVESASNIGSTFYFTLPVLSLPDILGPILSEESGSCETVALIRVDLWAHGGWPNENVREIASREARYVLSRCVLPDLDVVLPKLGFPDNSECVFVAARADVKGALVLEKRIRGQLERDERLKREGVAWDTETRMIPLARSGGDAQQRLNAKLLATKVRSEIEEWTRFGRQKQK